MSRLIDSEKLKVIVDGYITGGADALIDPTRLQAVRQRRFPPSTR